MWYGVYGFVFNKTNLFATDWTIGVYFILFEIAFLPVDLYKWVIDICW